VVHLVVLPLRVGSSVHSQALQLVVQAYLPGACAMKLFTAVIVVVS
jgi:hypothetical protein